MDVEVSNNPDIIHLRSVTSLPLASHDFPTSVFVIKTSVFSGASDMFGAPSPTLNLLFPLYGNPIIRPTSLNGQDQARQGGATCNMLRNLDVHYNRTGTEPAAVSNRISRLTADIRTAQATSPVRTAQR
jgi:hypothetical protein